MTCSVVTCDAALEHGLLALVPLQRHRGVEAAVAPAPDRHAGGVHEGVRGHEAAGHRDLVLHLHGAEVAVHLPCTNQR